MSGSLSNASSPAPSGDVADTFSSYDEPVRWELLALRQLVLETAAETAGVGSVEEGLRWGQPSYLTTETGSGSTIRLAPTAQTSPHDYALFFICNTDLIARFKDLFGDRFTYDGDRALLFSIGDEIPVAELRECIAIALTYHLARSTNAVGRD